jgi:squalene-hopene/tetraprenyl-beta-curcumene cyclase
LPGLTSRIDDAIAAAFQFLLRTQREDGAWIPLWFGNQYAPGDENPLYGTSRVLRAAGVSVADAALQREWRAACARGQAWMLESQNDDGGWGGAPGTPSSIEETALALDALGERADTATSEACVAAIDRGLAWLERATKQGSRFPVTPIGLYFAKLWYSEKLYPLIFTVSALHRVRRKAAAG